MLSFEKGMKNILIITFLMVTLTALLPIRGPYVLNDSYVHAKNVERFLDGDFKLWDITGPTDLFPTALGALLAKTFGYSLGILRLTNVILSTVGLISFYLFLRYLNLSKAKSLLGTLLLMFNPLYTYSTFSFMTEIPFLATAIISIYFYQKGIEENKKIYILLGSVFCSLSFLSRQVGLFIMPATFLNLILRSHKERKFPNGKEILLVCIIPTTVFLWYHFVYPSPAGYHYFNLVKELAFLSQPREAIPTILLRILQTLYYLGVFFGPLIIGVFLSNLRQLKSRKILATSLSIAVALCLFTGFLWLKEKRLMFYLPNIITYAGFIPSELSSGVKQTVFADSPVRVKGAITLGSIILTVAAILIFTKLKKREVPTSILSLYSLISFLAIFLHKSFYDRYLLLFCPLIIIKLLESISQRKAMIAFSAALVVYGTVVTAYEYDYLSANKKIGELVQKYGTHRTYSTFSLNGYYHLEKSAGMTPEEIFDQRKWQLKKEGAPFLISYSPLYGREVLEETYYQTPLGKNFKIPLYVLGPRANSESGWGRRVLASPAARLKRLLP